MSTNKNPSTPDSDSDIDNQTNLAPPSPLPFGEKLREGLEVLPLRKPDWLRVKLPIGKEYSEVRKITSTHKLHTICESGNCPNMGECWGAGTATFMILGNICTRSCGFCNVATGKPKAVDLSEPERVAESVRLMKVKHCVITSVDRDDLKDGGSTIWAETITAIRRLNPQTKFETLIPDFQGKWENLQRIIDVKPDIVSHNTETVRRLTKQVRIQAKYDRSLEVLKRLKDAGLKTKSGIMLGLGETEQEIYETMDDLRAVGCDVLTLGQYLQPTPKHLPVKEFIHPEVFEKYKQVGLEKGFRFVESGPLVRSSYHAEKHIF
ncbi:MAG: lipoyl synthase [Bacteroidetes bacterium]|nr:lipoyl synthase [Bacteroidota bacterium]